jgi:hypothetical protein
MDRVAAVEEVAALVVERAIAVATTAEDKVAAVAEVVTAPTSMVGRNSSLHGRLPNRRQALSTAASAPGMATEPGPTIVETPPP